MTWRTIFCRRLPFLTAMVGLFAGWAGTLLAQEAAPAAPADGEVPSYGLPYGVVLMGVVLGLLFVLNSSRRRDRAKPEVYGEPG